ncbi:MAG TPA: hypothetical protein VFW87_12195 [Pirellulales bacterium]|nr:hypothetical protein [Pirellulales bacterium]
MRYHFIVLFVACLLSQATSMVANEPSGKDKPAERATADDKEKSSDAGDRAAKLERAERLNDMRRRAEAIQISRFRSGEPVATKLIEEPLLRFNDTARFDLDGTVWGWGEGRPAALMELYPKSDPPGVWVYVFTSLSAGPLDAKVAIGAQRWNWAPKTAGFVAQSFPKAPPPADKPALRLRQMKELARRLTAHEFWDPDNSRFELRLLAQPVHRYQDAAAGVADAAIFLLAHGTNPEVVAVIEATGDEPARHWQCAFMRLGHAEMHVEIDGKEVWRKERLGPTSLQDPYWLTVSYAPQ